MTDLNLRSLERAAVEGGQEEKTRLLRARARSGVGEVWWAVLPQFMGCLPIERSKGDPRLHAWEDNDETLSDHPVPYAITACGLRTPAAVDYLADTGWSTLSDAHEKACCPTCLKLVEQEAPHMVPKLLREWRVRLIADQFSDEPVEERFKRRWTGPGGAK